MKYLRQHELLVTLQLDEIHFNPKMSYQNEKLIGNAGNNNTKPANRRQTLMVSSILSSNKYGVDLIQRYKMTTQEFYHVTKEVLKCICVWLYDLLIIRL